MAATIYVGTVQYLLCCPLEDSDCSVETLHVDPAVSCSFSWAANNLCLTHAMQQHKLSIMPPSHFPKIAPPPLVNQEPHPFKRGGGTMTTLSS